MHFYSIHVIAEYNLSGSEIICRQIHDCTSVFTWIMHTARQITRAHASAHQLTI